MNRLFVIAVRNVLRNKRRSFFNGLAMLVGVGFVVFLIGFFNGFLASIIRGSVEGGLGAVQVHRKGFLDAATDPLKQDMPMSMMAQINAVPGVVAVAPRINFEGLLNNGEQATVMMGIAIAPALEYTVCPQRRTFEVDGSLTAEDEDKAILGAELAHAMDLAPGASATVLGATQNGNSNALDLSVKGRLESPMPFASKRSVIVTLPFAQRLLRMPNRVTEFAIAVSDLDQADAVAAAVQAAVGSDYEAITWKQRDAAAASFVTRLTVIRAAISIILLTLVLSFIVNTMMSAVYERVREIGTMLAVGVRRSQVLWMFLFEAAFLGFCASLAGSIIGALVITWLQHRGVVLQPPGAKPTSIYPFVTVMTLVFSIGASMCGAAVAALYPAFKASRLQPVDALRSV